MSSKIFHAAAAVAAACVLVTGVGISRAQDLQPGTLHWPLWKLDTSDPNNTKWPEPRLGVTNSLGNFQGSDYTDAYLSLPEDQRDRYLHPGVDIRGANFDVVEAPETGDVWLTNADTDFCPHEGNSTNTQCRIYLLDPQKRYVYYFSHIDYAAAQGPTADSVRIAVENARTLQDTYDGSMSTADLVKTADHTRINRGQFIGVLADFSGYHHTHFGVYDLQSNFDMLDPMIYLEHRPATGFDYLDTDVPLVHDLYLEQEASVAGKGTRVSLSGSCPQLTGGKYDVIANMEDSLNSANGLQTGEYAMLSSVHRARMIMQRAHGARDERQWYDFDHLPLQCAGNWKTGACTGTTWQTFFDVLKFSKAALADATQRQGVLGADAGAIIRDKLFAFGTEWWSDRPSKYLQVLTHSWGQDGNWDGDTAPEGLYYLTGEAEDAAGNKASKSLMFVLNRSGSPLGSNVVGDIMVRDRTDDTGATPSSAGGQPFWISPDIIIRKWEDRDEVISAPDINAINPMEPKVVAGEKYALFIRVRNAGCASVSGISATLYAADPAPVPGNWKKRDLGTLNASGTLGPASPDAQVLLVGPFEYVPNADEAGHRCLLAAVTSAIDPVGADVTNAPNDNNVAQRNVQINGPFKWGLNNPLPAPAKAVLRFTADKVPFTANNPELWIQNDPALAPWASAPGTTTRVEGSQLVIHFNASPLSLPEVTLPAATGLPAEFRATSPNDGISYVFHFEQSLDGESRGGVSFTVVNGIIL